MSVEASRVQAQDIVQFRQSRTGVAAWPAGLWRFTRRKPLGAISAVIILTMIFRPRGLVDEALVLRVKAWFQ